MSTAERIDEAMLMSDPDTGERRAMSPGLPSGALVGLARAATRRNIESWAVETICGVVEVPLSVERPNTCRQPAVRGMSTALIGRRRITESRSVLIALLLDNEESVGRVDTFVSVADVLSARVLGAETEAGEEVGVG